MQTYEGNFNSYNNAAQNNMNLFTKSDATYRPNKSIKNLRTYEVYNFLTFPIPNMNTYAVQT
jgi:hypothetical protein